MQAAGLITYVTKHEQNLSTLAGRLKWLRGKRGVSQEQLAQSAGVAQGTIGNLESGERKTARKLASIASALEANPLWLETGRGDWQAAKGSVFSELTPEERELIESWRHLLGSDRRTKLKEIAELARERNAQRQELFEEAGVTRIAERAAAQARRTSRTTSAAKVAQPSATTPEPLSRK